MFYETFDFLKNLSSYLLALFIILVGLMMTCNSRKQFIYGLLNSQKKRTKLTEHLFTQDSGFLWEN